VEASASVCPFEAAFPGMTSSRVLASYFFACTLLAAKTSTAMPSEMRRIRSQFCAMTRKWAARSMER